MITKRKSLILFETQAFLEVGLLKIKFIRSPVVSKVISY